MTDSLKKLFQQLKDFDANPKSAKLSLARKREMVFQVLKFSQILQKRQLMEQQGPIVEFVFTLTKYGCGASLIRELSELLRFLYCQGGDFTKLQQEFFDPAIQLINNAKTQTLQRLILTKLTGKLFKHVWTRCPNPPTKDLFEAFTKMKPASTEKFLRESAYKSLKDVIKCNPSNLFQVQQEMIKHFVKAAKEEKLPTVKVEMVTCLWTLVKQTMNYSTMHTNYDTILQAALKGFEEPDQDLQQAWVKVVASLLGLRLQESQQQGDIKTSFKVYNQAQKEALAAAKKKPINTLLEVPRTLGDALIFLSAQVMQQNNTLTVKQAVLQVVSTVVQQNVVHLEATEIELILSPLVLNVTGKKEEIAMLREFTFETLSKIAEAMQQDQRNSLVKCALQCLENRQVQLSSANLQMLQSFCARGQTIQSQINEHQTMVLLQLTSTLIFKMEPNTFHSVFQSERDLLQKANFHLTPAFPLEVKVQAVELIKVIGFRAPKWIHNLISTYLSLTSIQNADNQSLTQTPVYAGTIPEKSNLRKELLDNCETLKVLATALACLIQSLPATIKGVPLALVTTALNAAKNQILGNMPIELPPEHQYRLDLGQVKISDSQRQESGWIILQGLCMLGSDWIDTQVSLIFKLLKTVFCRSMCQIDQKKLKDTLYQEVLLRELKIKSAALSCVYSFLQHSSTQTLSRTNSLIAKLLGNCLEFTFHPTGSNIDKIFKHYLPSDLSKARHTLILCLSKLPPELIKNQVTLLHTLCEFVTDGPVPDSSLMWQADSHLTALKAEDKTSSELDVRDTLLTELTRHDGVDCGISLLANLFMGEELQDKQKVQVLQHLQQQVEQELKEMKSPTKLLRICTFVLLIAKLDNQLQLKVGSVASYNLAHATQHALLSSECHFKLLELAQSMQAVENDHLIILQSEAYIYLLAPKIVQRPNQVLPQILNELETHALSSKGEGSRVAKKRAAVVLGMIARLFDLELVIGQSAKQLNQLVMKLIKETDQSVRRFTLHFCCEIATEGFFTDEEDLCAYFNSVFPSVFHLFQTDVQPNFQDMAALSRMVNAQLRFFEPDVSKSPPSPLRQFLSSNVRMQSLIHEMIELVFLGKTKHMKLLAEAIQLVKTAIVAGMDVAVSNQEAITTRCIELLRDRNLPMSLKQGLVETLAAAFLKGYLQTMPKLASGLQYILIDELNEATIKSQVLGSGRTKVDFDKTFSGSDQFECLINYDGTNDQVDLKRSLKVLLLFVFKLNPTSGPEFPKAFGNLLALTKSVVSYKHSTISQQLELGIKAPQSKAIVDDPNGFFYQNDLREEVIHFVVKAFKSYVSLFATVQAGNGDFGESKLSDVRGQISNLINLAFTVTSQDSTPLKKVGLKLIILLVELFSQATDKVSDDDDEDDKLSTKQRIKTFMASSLLLEQYEAQIFSIIRTNLQRQEGKSQIDPEITAINYELIYLFITTPICKDQGSIKKIIDILMEQMERTQLVGVDMHSYEGVITDTHFRKLILLSKLLLVSQKEGEASIARLSQLEDEGGQAVRVQRSHQRERSLPSKFTNEDQEKLSELIFKEDTVKLITKHLTCALSDALIAQLGNHGNARKFTFITSVGGQGSAYTPRIIQQAVPYALQALCLISSKRQISLSAEQSLAVRASLLQNLTFQPNLAQGRSIEKADIARFANQKRIYLEFADEMLASAPQLIVKTPAELEELYTIVTKLPSLGIIELNLACANVIKRTIPMVSQIGFQKKALDFASQMVYSRFPELVRENSEKGDGFFGGFEEPATIESQRSNKKNKCQLSPEDMQSLLKMGTTLLIDITEQLVKQKSPLLQELMRTFLASVVLQLDLLEESGHKTLLVSAVKNMIEAISTSVLNDPSLQQFLEADCISLSCKMVLSMVASETTVSAHSLNLFKALINCCPSKTLELRSTIQLLSQHLGKTSPGDLISTLQTILETNLTQLRQEAICQTSQLVHESLIAEPNDKTTSDCLHQISSFYKNSLTTEQRAKFLPVYLSVLFTIMQTRSLSQQTRQLAAESILAIFQADQQAFKLFAAPNPATGLSNLTMPEKTLIENVIKQMSAIKQASQPTIQAQGGQKPASQSAQTSQSQSSVQASKIKLGFNFKANK